MANTRGMPPADDWLVRRIKNLEHKVRMLEGARRLESATIGEDGITVTDDGSIKFTNSAGQLLLTLDGQNGLTATKLGRIGNASLASPVIPMSGYADTGGTGVNMPASSSDLATGSISVPGEYTTVLTFQSITVGASRSASSAGGFSIQAWTEMRENPAGWYWNSLVVSTLCPGSGYTSFTTDGVGLYQGLPGTDWNLDFGSWVAPVDSGGWASASVNAHTSVLALFFR